MRSIDSNYNPIWRIEFGSRLSPIGRIELHTYMNVYIYIYSIYFKLIYFI